MRSRARSPARSRGSRRSSASRRCRCRNTRRRCARRCGTAAESTCARRSRSALRSGCSRALCRPGRDGCASRPWAGRWCPTCRRGSRGRPAGTHRCASAMRRHAPPRAHAPARAVRPGSSRAGHRDCASPPCRTRSPCADRAGGRAPKAPCRAAPRLRRTAAGSSNRRTGTSPGSARRSGRCRWTRRPR